MPDEGFTLKLDAAAIRKLTEDVGQPVGLMMHRIGVKFVSRARYYASGNDGGPNVDTGTFRSSLDYDVGRDEQGLYVDCGSNVEYAPFLELGTRYMAARPSIRPAAREASETLGA
jgi:hypothetical protein